MILNIRKATFPLQLFGNFFTILYIIHVYIYCINIDHNKNNRWMNVPKANYKRIKQDKLNKQKKILYEIYCKDLK